jgi:NADPH:quinone reductase-like Zn-dependent oxidoreductase
MAIQLARESGAVVTALVRDAAAAGETLRRLCAGEVVERMAGDFDVILDAVGGATFGSAIEHLTPGGLLVNLATSEDEETVTFRAPRFDRAHLHAQPARRARTPRRREPRPRTPVRACRRRPARRPG